MSDLVFSMEGTRAPLGELIELRERFGFLLVVDAAHATLVDDPAATRASAGSIDFRVGTLSKAFGALGGFVATRHRNRRFLLNTGRPFIFSTALPLPVVAAARAALAVATADPSIRARLWSRVRAWDAGLESPIASLVLGSDAAALEASRALWEAGFHVPAIRPPTVPEGTARLRIAFSAAHAPEDLAALRQACGALPGWGRRSALP